MDNKLSELSKPVAWEMRYWNNGYYTWGEWERITSEQHAEMSIQHATDNDYEFRVLYTAPPAPAVPPEALPDDIPPEHNINTYSGITWAAAWNACRAAMLNHVGDTNEKGAAKCECSSIDYCGDCLRGMMAQPVSQRYTLPDGFKLMPLEITDEIGEAIAMEARCCGGIALCIYEAALAAAKQGDADKI